LFFPFFFFFFGLQLLELQLEELSKALSLTPVALGCKADPLYGLLR
jgi:hypothetical protein